MRMEKKRILKEDGRALYYYHFAETATTEETAVFEAIVPQEAEPHTDESEENSHV